jgi:hypothetical protein
MAVGMGLGSVAISRSESFACKGGADRLQGIDPSVRRDIQLRMQALASADIRVIENIN